MRIQLLVFLLFISNFLFAQLSGNYTIGGVNSNYPTLDSAVSVLNSIGVKGPVNFKIRQGTYNERIVIGNYTGSSATNTVTFLPDSGKKNGVLLRTVGARSTNNYIIKLDTASHVIIKYLDFYSASSGYCNAITLTGFVNHITIDGCKIRGVLSGFASVGRDLFSDLAYRSNDITITNNEFINGNSAITLLGGVLGINENWLIKKNKISGFFYRGIDLGQYSKNIEIDQNEIYPKLNHDVSSVGIYGNILYGPYKITRNEIVMGGVKHSNCIRLSNLHGTSGKEILISNNMLASFNANSKASHVALYIYSANYTHIFHNSLSTATSYSSGTTLAFDFTSGSGKTGNQFFNNICAAFEKNQGFFTYAARISGQLIKGHNIYYSPDGITTIGIDSSSYVSKPIFYSFSDLHIKQNDTIRQGLPISSLQIDFDGDTRSTTHPSIGADEIFPPVNDASASRIENERLCVGGNDIYLRVRNQGDSILKSFDTQWAFSKNGALDSINASQSFTSSLSLNEDTLVHIGTLTTSLNDDYVIRAWITSPNAVPDSNNLNDTTRKTYLTSMKGTYTIGGSSPDFATIDSACKYIMRVGICGPTHFLIRPGVYSDTVQIGEIYGSSTYNYLIIQNDTNFKGEVIWKSADKNLEFNRTSDITIRGITFENLRSTTNRSDGAIIFLDTNQRIRITNCKLRFGQSQSTNYNLVNGKNCDQCEQITIDSCKFEQGSIWLAGLIFNHTYKVDERHIIRDNYFDSLKIGIQLYQLRNLRFEGNFIRNSQITQSAYFGRCENLSILNNSFQGNLTIWTAKVNIYDCRPFSGVDNRIINNSFQNVEVQLSSCKSLYFYHNTIRHIGGAGWNNGIVVSGGTGWGSTYIRNNIISIKGVGFCMKVQHQNNVINNISHNVYHREYTSTTQNNNNGLVHLNGSYTSYANWKSFTKDTFALFNDPMFIHPFIPYPKNSLIKNNGKPLGVYNDYFFQNRDSLKPTRGCIEFELYQRDGGIYSNDTSFCPRKSPLGISLVNYSTDTIKSIKMSWIYSRNNAPFGAISSKSFTLTLNPNDTTVLTLDSIYILSKSLYHIKVQIDSLNRGIDSLSVNNNYNFRIYSILPSVGNITSIDSVCSNSAPISLSGTPTTGVFYGPGIAGKKFNPSSLPSGFNTLNYSFTDSNTCADTISKQIWIDTTPTISLNIPDSICINNTPIQLNSGKPLGGKYSGKDVVGSKFAPIRTGYTIIFYEVKAANGCEAKASDTIRVDSIPIISLNLPKTFCQNDSTISLNHGSPLGGTYNVNGVINSSFSPSKLGVGSQLVKYTVGNANGCNSSDSSFIVIKAKPNATISGSPIFCEKSQSNSLSVGLPIGGKYFGLGITFDSIFNPQLTGIGKFVFNYSFTDSSNCSDTAKDFILVSKAVSARIDSLFPKCASDSDFVLSGGTPKGGAFFGVNVDSSNQTFLLTQAGLGNHIIYYASLDSNGCRDTVSGSVDKFPIPVIPLPSEVKRCKKSPPILDAGGNFNSYLWNTGDTTRLLATKFATTYKVIVTDSNGCSSSKSVLVILGGVCVGINSAQPTAGKVIYYPNPTSGEVTIEGIKKAERIVLMDATGKEIDTRRQVFEEVKFDLSNLNSGIYLIRITFDNGNSQMIRILKE